jgi:hypothetical protein
VEILNKFSENIFYKKKIVQSFFFKNLTQMEWNPLNCCQKSPESNHIKLATKKKNFKKKKNDDGGVHEKNYDTREGHITDCLI